MPTSINFGQIDSVLPGVYSKIIDALPGQDPLDIGNVALVGDFKELEQNVPHTFSKKGDFESYFPSLTGDYADIAKIAFTPIADSKGVKTLTLISTQNSTQGEVTDTATTNLTFKSRLYGNRTGNINVEAEITDATLQRAKITADSEAINFSYGTGAAIEYNEVANTEATIALTRTIDSTGLKIKATVTEGSSNAATFADIDIPCASTVVISGGGNANVVNIKGKSLAGADLEENVTLNEEGDGTTTNIFGEITEQSNTGGNANVVLTFDVFSRDSAVPVQAAITDLKTTSSIFSASTTGTSTVLQISDLDRLDEADFSGAAVPLTKFASEAIKRSANLSFVEITATEGKVITATPFTGVIPNGTNGTEGDAADYVTAYEKLESLDINTVVPWTSLQTVIETKTKEHCTEAALQVNERNAYVGTATLATLNDIKGHIEMINDRNVSIVAQGITLSDRTVKAEPKWTALLLASMQAATPIARALTNLTPNILSTSEIFDPQKDAEALTSAGAILINSKSQRLRVVRSVTTYISDTDHVVYTEMSAVESLNICLKDLRSRLDLEIGNSNVSSNDIKRIASNRLAIQRDRGVIKDFKNVDCESVSSGQRINVTFDLAVTQPLNFITVTARLSSF